MISGTQKQSACTLPDCVATGRALCFSAQHDLLRQQMVRLKFSFDRLMYCSQSAAPLAGTTCFQTALHPATLSCSIMCHTRPRYFPLGDLQTTSKLSDLGCGFTDQSCPDCVATGKVLCFSAQHDLLQQQTVRLKFTNSSADALPPECCAIGSCGLLWITRHARVVTERGLMSHCQSQQGIARCLKETSGLQSICWCTTLP